MVKVNKNKFEDSEFKKGSVHLFILDVSNFKTFKGVITGLFYKGEEISPVNVKGKITKKGIKIGADSIVRNFVNSDGQNPELFFPFKD